MPRKLQKKFQPNRTIFRGRKIGATELEEDGEEEEGEEEEPNPRAVFGHFQPIITFEPNRILGSGFFLRTKLA